MQKKWYVIYGDTEKKRNILLAKVNGLENAQKIAELLKYDYYNVMIK